MTEPPERPAPLDYRRSRRVSPATRALRLALDALAILPALAVPAWAYFVTRRLAENAAKHATMPTSDVWLIALTFAIPIGFALIVCGPMARDDKTRWQ